MGKIVVVGSLNMDVVVGVGRFPKAGETILGNSMWKNPGGKGSNQAYAAAKAGGEVVMLGCIGDDAYGEELKSALADAGVNTDRIKISKANPTGTAFITVDENGQNQIIVIAGTNEECTADYVEYNKEIFEGASYCIVQMEVPEATVWKALELAKKAGVKTILNPAPAEGELPSEIYPMVDILTPNETELEALSGCRNNSLDFMKQGAELLLEKGTGLVIVTLGEKGALYVSRERSMLIEGFPANAVDTTCAGDCFNGTLAVCLSEGEGVEEAIRNANKASAISVTRKGALPSIPERIEWKQ